MCLEITYLSIIYISFHEQFSVNIFKKKIYFEQFSLYFSNTLTQKNLLTSDIFDL